MTGGRKHYYPEEHDKFGPNVSPVEAYNLEELQSDVNEQVWPSEPLEPAVGHPHSRHQHESVRTIGGALDLLHDVAEEVTEWVERESDGPGHAWPRNRDKPMVLHVYQRGSKSFRAATYNVGVASAGIKVPAREFRSHIEVTNWGPGYLYVQHETGTGLGQPAPNAVKIPPPGPDATQTGIEITRRFPTEAEMWLFPGTPGVAQVVEIVEYYSAPETA